MDTGDRCICFISEGYYPDEQGAAFYTTGLAVGLARYFKVKVLCRYPTVTARGSHVLQRVEYKDLGRDCFDKLNSKQLVPYLVNRLTNMGYEVNPAPLESAA